MLFVSTFHFGPHHFSDNLNRAAVGEPQCQRSHPDAMVILQKAFWLHSAATISESQAGRVGKLEYRAEYFKSLQQATVW